jgi:tRNA(Arg) A34 adenosine deaminase TadA
MYSTGKKIHISNSRQRLLDILKDSATTSVLNMKHSAMVLRGGKILSVGVNNQNNKIARFGVPCQHAEMSALWRCFLSRNYKEFENV